MKNERCIRYVILLLLAHLAIRLTTTASTPAYMNGIANLLLVVAIMVFLIMLNNYVGPKAWRAKTSGKLMMKAVYLHLKEAYPDLDTKTGTQVIAMLLDICQEHKGQSVQELLAEGYEMALDEDHADLPRFGEKIVSEALTQYTMYFDQADKSRAHNLAGDIIDKLQKGVFTIKEVK